MAHGLKQRLESCKTRMYYLLETNYLVEPGPYRTRAVQPPFGYAPSYWLRGRVMKAPEQPLQIELWRRGGNGLAELFLDSTPLFRDDLVRAIAEGGVDNLQAFPAVLTPPGGEPITDYKAVNIVGLVRCADLGKSEYDDVAGAGMMAVSFRKLVIDEKAAGGSLFFRLAEAVASVVVHEKIKALLDARDFRYLSWRPLKE